jgi:hypothetical protein
MTNNIGKQVYQVPARAFPAAQAGTCWPSTSSECPPPDIDNPVFLADLVRLETDDLRQTVKTFGKK